MKPFFIQGVILAALLSCSIGTAARVYKWIDPDGRVYFSDKPDNRDAVELDVKSSRTDKERINQQLQARLDARQAAAADAQKAAQQSAQLAEKQELLLENCRRAQDALAGLNLARRLFVPDGNGGRRYLSDDETAARREQGQKDVDKWCGLN